MKYRKQEEEKLDAEDRRQHYLSCQICGRKLKPEECSWQEDDDAGMCCQECMAETKSCGCSD